MVVKRVRNENKENKIVCEYDLLMYNITQLEPMNVKFLPLSKS